MFFITEFKLFTHFFLKKNTLTKRIQIFTKCKQFYVLSKISYDEVLLAKSTFYEQTAVTLYDIIVAVSGSIRNFMFYCYYQRKTCRIKFMTLRMSMLHFTMHIEILNDEIIDVAQFVLMTRES